MENKIFSFRIVDLFCQLQKLKFELYLSQAISLQKINQKGNER